MVLGIDASEGISTLEQLGFGYSEGPVVGRATYSGIGSSETRPNMAVEANISMIALRMSPLGYGCTT